MNHYQSKQEGLYDPFFEHDACGIGFIAQLNGNPSHDLLEKGIEMLIKLDHRGGKGSDPNTGDGAGILIQIPHPFFKKEAEKVGIKLPQVGEYGVGMLFLPYDQQLRHQQEEKISQIAMDEGFEVLWWRDVPVNPNAIGETAKNSMPFIRQIFLRFKDPQVKELDLERKLYLVRKQAEKWVKEASFTEPFYFASLSSRTIVYKGMLTPSQIPAFYLDLQDERFETTMILVHSRYSTNTFPSWERAHPNRYLVHNGEINTLRGNINWMFAREKAFRSPVFNEELTKVLPVLDVNGSDSAMLDNALEFFYLNGYALPHAAMMMIPEPWEKDDTLSEEKKAFYEYHSHLMEPWDGPTAICFSNGKEIGAMLDRNGLRPARYTVTKDGWIFFSSEAGVIELSPDQVKEKGRLGPGKMLWIDLEKGKIVKDKEIKKHYATEKPYKEWLLKNQISFDQLPPAKIVQAGTIADEELLKRQVTHGYTIEEFNKFLIPMAKEGKDPIGSMGYDAPLAVLSDRPQLLFNYFKQSFAQVTNPPIDALREAFVTSTSTLLGAEGNLLEAGPQNAHRIRLKTPILTDADLKRLTFLEDPSFQLEELDILFPVAEGEKGLEKALENLFLNAEEAIHEGKSLLLLTDRKMNGEWAPIPSLLAVSGLHHHLIRQGLRMKVSLLLETGEVREVHHFSVLIGYGADAINPYLAFATLRQLQERGELGDLSYEKAEKNYIKAVTDGILKVMSKMGISSIQSYRGAQIFDAIGISKEVIDRYFTRTASPIGGISLEMIAKETLMRQSKAYSSQEEVQLDVGGELQYRKNGEEHVFIPKANQTLQQAVRKGDYELYKKYAEMVQEGKPIFIRHLLKFKSGNPIPIDEVESVDSIVTRFKTGAMSYGALSQEVHETLAIGMNRLGGKSNSGEGGEDPSRFIVDEAGDSKSSAIKQVASGRFGVTSHYLVNAKEIQIKMAQGAKPGEGGQLPGKKVYPWIAQVRRSTPGVGLISPPPHHDIYSIEDLAQLIYDLKNANPEAKISVKLVSKPGVGTIAAGVAKGLADTILISGYDGGTGASPITSIQHAGFPWEIGLAETHQTLMLNGLRDRVKLETDGKLLTGRDVVIAAMLGAEEYGFSTAPLIALGCVMARVCHNDTCPTGIATQDPELRKRYRGKPEHLINFMRFIAQEVREIMAELGFRTIDEMIGRTDYLMPNEQMLSHWKANSLDLSALLYRPEVPDTVGQYKMKEQEYHLEESLDMKVLLPLAEEAIQERYPVSIDLKIKNTNRTVGTILGSEITRKYGEAGLPEDLIRFNFYGAAGQSFGAFLPHGVTLKLEGEANDYVGKGLSGGKIIITPPAGLNLPEDENVLIGNVAFYGATAGEAYIAGIAGERFCVRNSGIKAVVEGVGDHGLEYMTGGRVVILGSVGKNFAAGMSGGIAYLLAADLDELKERTNQNSILFETLTDSREIARLKQMIENHYHFTGSKKAERILRDWEAYLPRFIKIIPVEYKVMVETIERYKRNGHNYEEASLFAFRNRYSSGKVSDEEVEKVV